MRLEGIGGEDMHVPDKVSSILEGLEAGESMETVRKVGRKARGNTQGWPGSSKWRDNQEDLVQMTGLTVRTAEGR